MPIIARAPADGDFELLPPGAYAARCYQVVDLGIVESGGMFPGSHHKVRIAWEVDHLMSDGRPFSVSERLTLSLHKKSRLTQRLVSWRGKAFTEQELDGFDLAKLMGAPCLINVVHTHSQDGTRTYTNVASISPMPRGMKAPDPSNPPLVWSWGDPEDKLPEWLRKQLGKDPREPAPTPEQDSSVPAWDDDDDVPF